MNQIITPQQLFKWCSIPYDQLASHPELKVAFRIVNDSTEMGAVMASELAEEIDANNKKNKKTRAIIPCGPSSWYKPFTDLINAKNISLKNLVVFHMDECLDWQGRELPKEHPYNFRAFMEKFFYEPIHETLAVPLLQRIWLNSNNVEAVKQKIEAEPVDITFGGWGQDGHVAYNQARRHPFSHITLDELRESTIRIQENNIDTIIALSQRSFGGAYQFVPPMSVTLGLKECLGAKKIRLFSDTGSWKQTALRVALFGSATTEYPITLLQEHKDALITATIDTAKHPVSENPDWKLF